MDVENDSTNSPDQQVEPLESPEKLSTITTIHATLTANSFEGIQGPSIFYLDGFMQSQAHVVDWSKPGISEVRTLAVNFHSPQINGSQNISNSLNLISEMTNDSLILIHVLGDSHSENISSAKNSKINIKFMVDLCNRLLRVVARMVDGEVKINQRAFKSSAATSKKFSKTGCLKHARGVSNLSLYIFSIPKFLKDFLSDKENDDDLKFFVNELQYLFHV